jgi:acyl-homoserine lactone synthase
MIHVITSQNAGDHDDLMEQVWRFRHRQFVERLGWTELRSEHGREFDRFDTDDAIHLALVKAGAVVGYTRLLRTSGPHLLANIYPEIMQGHSWPRADDIYEWTRCICDEQAGSIGGVQASHMLITGILEFCLLAGIRGMIVETHPKLVTWMRETGYEVQALNATQVINGVPVVPVYIGAAMPALQRHRQMFGIEASVLSLDEGLLNPVTGQALLCSLPLPASGKAAEELFQSDLDFGVMGEISYSKVG